MLSFAVLQSALFSVCHAEELVTVPTVEPQRYMGKWYEIALIPFFLENKCKRGTTEEYKMESRDIVAITHQCMNARGQRVRDPVQGKVMNLNNTKIRLSFLQINGRWIYPAGTDYWIFGLPSNYSYALAGSPTRRYGWILARTPSLPVETLRRLAQDLSSHGFDVCQFVTTPQPGGFSQRRSLCEILY